MKKLVIAVLALVVVLGLSTVAFAADDWCQDIEGKECKLGDWTVSIAATCDKPAVVAKYCTVCGEQKEHKLDVEEQYMKQPDHVMGDWYTVVAADCTKEAAGSEKRDCANCKYFETRGTEYAHAWDAGREISAPACGVQGQVLYTCTAPNCYATYKAYTKALEHDMNDVRVIKPATCKETGWQEFHCSKCGIEMPENPSKKLYNEIPMVDHVLVNYGVLEDATCLKKGTMQASCQNCRTRAAVTFGADGKAVGVVNYGKALTAAQVESLVINAKGHDMKVTSSKPATCLANGENVYTCARLHNGVACNEEGYTYTKILYASEEYHKLDEKIIAPATETSKGLKHVWCTICDYKEDIVFAYEPETPDEPTTDEPSTEKPEDTEKPDAPVVTPDDNGTEGSKPTTTPSGVVIPATGDNTSNAAFVVLAAAIVGLAVLAISKKARA